MTDTEIRMMRYTIEQLSAELQATKQYVSDIEPKLERTRKALDILLFTINRLENQNYKDCAWHLRLARAKIEAMGIANKALEQITALEQKDK